MSERIGVLGLGRMGLPIAVGLAGCGNRVRVLDVDPDRSALAARAGVTVADDVAALASASDILITVLPGPTECRDALTGPHGALSGLARGSVWLDLTSNDPEVTTSLAREARDRGVASVAAPMRGGPADAESRSLAFYTAGDPAALARVSPVLIQLGQDPAARALSGDPAMAHVVKLLANTLWFGQVIATTEALLLGRELGMDAAALLRALASSPGDSAFLREHGPRLLTDDDMPDFGIDRVVEELETVVRLASSTGVPHELTALVTRMHRDALRAHGAVGGELLAARLLEERLGRPLREAPERDAASTDG